MQAPSIARAASVVLMLEGLALVAIAGIEAFGLFRGEAASAVSGTALVVLTLIGAAALIIFAVGVRRGRSWARSGAVVAHVLAIALALAALTVQPVAVAFLAALGIPGVVGLALLLLSARREALPRAAEPQPED